MKGIDISNCNGNVNFDAVKSAGVEVIIMKATEGVDFKDSKLESYYSQAIARGFNIGFYHFMSERTSPTQQAIDFFNTIKDKEYNVIPCLDIETNNQGRSASQITDRCLEFLNKFKELSGYDCMIYTGGYFGRDNLDSRIKGYPAWIAHYGVSQPMNTGFGNLVGHQYSETGSVPGISGNVDMDVFYEGVLLGNAKKVVTTNNVSSGYSQTIKDFQTQYNMTYNKQIAQDGIYGPNTENAINSCCIKQGMKNSLVGFVQVRIGTVLDYSFGPNTFNALKAYQESNGLVVDGIAGPNTFRKLLGL